MSGWIGRSNRVVGVNREKRRSAPNGAVRNRGLDFGWVIPTRTRDFAANIQALLGHKPDARARVHFNQLACRDDIAWAIDHGRHHRSNGDCGGGLEKFASVHGQIIP